MKELNKKVFRTIFVLLSLFIITGIVIYNVSSYKKEYNNVKRNLTFMDNRNISKNEINPPEPRDFNKSMINPKDRDLDNMMIMDYEVYTVKISNNKIEKIISHSNDTSDFDVNSIAEIIINNDKGLKIGNLYHNNYSYYYQSDSIIIINTDNINNRLLVTLIVSILFLVGLEFIIYFIAVSLTKKITKPALEAFNKQKDFIADASHELKTPLSIIIASSDELKSDKKNKKYIDNIKYESERMNNLIKGLLDLSKLEKGISINSYKDENISKIVERISLTFEAIAFENKLQIETNIEDNVIFKCCKEEIEKLISIIIDNAIKHGYPNTYINVILRKEKDNINIEITNEGDPIKKEDEERIFERFYRADKSRNREANRYGLGLSIAKNIVLNHNGTIRAFSKNGITKFIINLKK